jgi:hypothetical protein
MLINFRNSASRWFYYKKNFNTIEFLFNKWDSIHKGDTSGAFAPLFSRNFYFVAVFKKNIDYTSTYMKWAHPLFTQENVDFLLILATYFQSIGCKFIVDYNLYFGQDEISYFFSCKERNLRSIVFDCFVMLLRQLFLWPQLILYRGQSQL